MPRDRGPSLKKILGALDLAKITSVLRPCYRKWERGDGKTGRPPVNPVALTITLLFSLLRGWHRNDLIAFLERHEEWRRWLGLEFVPDDTTWSKFLDRVGDERLEKLFRSLIRDLHERGVIRLLVTAVDGSFLPGCHWDKDTEWGYVRKNDKRDLPEGSFLVNEDGTLLGKGYRVHAIVDADTELPVAIHLTTANVNDSTAWKDLFETSKESVDWEHVGWLTGDKGYDTGLVRSSIKDFSVRPAIPAA